MGYLLSKNMLKIKGNIVMKRRTVIAQISCGIETVWNIVTDNRNYAWRSDLSKIEILDENHFDEYTKDGFVTHFCITEKEKCHTYRFNMDNQNMSGCWTGIFENCEIGTQITFTEAVQVKHPIMNLFVSGYLKKQQSAYIADLRKAIGGA